MNTEGTQEEAMAATAGNSSSSANNDVYSHHAIVKGKRTKRQRLLQAVAPRAVPTSPVSSSGDFSGSTTTEEEEDMANCLMLLAQGHMREADTKLATQIEEESDGGGSGGGGGCGGGGEKVSSRRSAEAATTNGKVGSYVYECKTCNKCFPSFQALGGHRASHKKPKTASAAAATDDKKQADEDSLQISIASYPKLHILPNSDGGRTTTTTFDNNATVNTCKARVHECSICGSEFSSGQALGGHMRRHRPAATVPEPPQEAPKKERSLLSLDLNLPAPSDDDRGDFPRSPSFAFTGKPPLIFSASALVNCHY